MAWVFGELELDPDRRELRSRGDLVALEPQAFDVLVYLVTHHDRVVPKEELMDQIWAGRFVSEAAVTSRIKQARRAVGDDGQSQAYIRTSHGRGYRFVAEVGQSSGPGPDRPATSTAAPASKSGVRSPILSVRSGENEITYQITGQGPPDVVLLTGSSFPLASAAEDPSSLAHASEQIITAVADFIEDAATAQAPSRSLSALSGLAGATSRRWRRCSSSSAAPSGGARRTRW